MLKLFLGLIAFVACIYMIGLIGAVIGAAFELIFQYWWVLALGMILAVAAYFYRKHKAAKKREQMIRELEILREAHRIASLAVAQENNLRSMVQKGQAEEISSMEDAEAFFGSCDLVRSFHARVRGTSYPNDDGSSRQEILSRCLVGEPVSFNWHTFNGDPACSVISDHGQIGFLAADLAADLVRDYDSDDYYFVAQISDITGGYDGYSYGCNLLIAIYRSYE